MLRLSTVLPARRTPDSQINGRVFQASLIVSFQNDRFHMQVELHLGALNASPLAFSVKLKPPWPVATARPPSTANSGERWPRL